MGRGTEEVCSVFWQQADQASWYQDVQRGLPACWLALKSALIHFREMLDVSVYIKVDLSDCAFDRGWPIRALLLLFYQDHLSLSLSLFLFLLLGMKNLAYLFLSAKTLLVLFSTYLFMWIGNQVDHRRHVSLRLSSLILQFHRSKA